MDYVESDLKQLMKQIPKVELTEDHVITIMYNILCSLNFLHTANIMHRDIKPSNILIGSECQVKLCDFGLSRTIPLEELIVGKTPRSKAEPVHQKHRSHHQLIDENKRRAISIYYTPNHISSKI
jgi:serine/threonine protein kinase